MTTTISIPDNVLTLAGLPTDELSRYMLELMVLDLFRTQRLSLGKSSEVLGLACEAFIELAAAHDIPIVNGDPEDIRAEIESWERYKREHQADR
jgi:predicted HTH domain antitoxin